jgi:NitT/TauT family transport system substrate-binding protein
LIDYAQDTDLMTYLGAKAYPLAHLQMTSDFIKANPGTTQKVVNGVMKALRFIGDHTPDECIAVVKDKYWAEADREVLVKYLAEIKGAFSPDGITTPEGYETVVKVNAAAGLLSLPAPAFESITDLRFVTQANKTLSRR